MPDKFTDDLRALHEQVHAGILLLEEILDATIGGDWVKPGRNPGGAARHAWGDLSMAWINLGTALLEDPDVEPWTIAPLVSRSSKGERSIMEFGPDRHLAVDNFDGGVLDALTDGRRKSPVRLVPRPSEPKYTLDEARKILEVCQEHSWLADVDDDGKPVGVRCATCNERRPLR